MIDIPNFVLFVVKNSFTLGCGYTALGTLLLIAYFFTLMRQTLLAPSSATSKEPSVQTATPTGRP